MRKETKTIGRRAKTRTSTITRLTRKQREINKKSKQKEMARIKKVETAYNSALDILQKVVDENDVIIKPDKFENFKKVVFKEYNTTKKIISFNESLEKTKRMFINEYTEDAIGNSHYWLSAKQVAAIMRAPGWQELAKEDGVELTEELILDTDWWRHYMDILTDAKISELYGSL